MLLSIAGCGFQAPPVAAPTELRPECPVPSPHEQVGVVDDPERDEISGLVASARLPGVWWVNEDSGDAARIYALDSGGRRLATFVVRGADAVDWEDLALATDADGIARIYVADMGDNERKREGVVVWRFPEPELDPASPVDGVTAPAERIDLRWPEGARNTETLLVDGLRGELVVVSKSDDGVSDVLVAPTAPGAHVLEKRGTLVFGPPPLETPRGPMTTGGALSPDRSTAVVRTYLAAWSWKVDPGASVADALLHGAPCPIALPQEKQGEAIAFTADSSAVVTTSEGIGQPLWRVQLSASSR